MALRGKAKLQRSAPTERRPLLEKQGKRGGAIWQSRSQLFVICLAVGLMTLTTSLFPALPPLAQSAREIQALLADTQLQTSLGSGEGIEQIMRTPTGYAVITRHYTLRVDVEYLPAARPGPAPFQFHFNDPIERSS